MCVTSQIIFIFFPRTVSFSADFLKNWSRKKEKKKLLFLISGKLLDRIKLHFITKFTGELNLAYYDMWAISLCVTALERI